MDKLQAVHDFWSGFGWQAYDEQTVPDEAPFPYITHESSTSDFDREIAQTASLWVMSTSWGEITAKEKEIAAEITKGGKMIRYDGGAVIIRMGSPWSQHLADETNDLVRSVVLNYTLEYID